MLFHVISYYVKLGQHRQGYIRLGIVWSF